MPAFLKNFNVDIHVLLITMPQILIYNLED